MVSPIFGDLSNLPPTLIHVSEAEILLDDARRYVNKARASGSPVRLQSWAGLLHVWQIFNPEVPEAEAVAKAEAAAEATPVAKKPAAAKGAKGALPTTTADKIAW